MRRRKTAHRFGEKRRTTDVLINEKVDFSGLMLSSDVLKGLNSSGFERPSPIQLKAIPLGRCGLDLIAQAKSGTGKTCVFSVIALENINWSVSSVQVLVLAPTREIAVQIKDVMCSIGQHLKGLQTHVFIGGMSLEDDKSHLKQCHIAIGTPGRIKHLIESKLLQTTSIRLFILDEADKLLEENFEAQTNWIFSTLPASKQMLALSATYPDHLAEQLKNYMKDPTFVRLNAADPSLEGIRHYRCVVPSHSLPHKIFHEKVQSLLQLLTKLSFHQCLIFSNYQIRARNLSETLSENGWPSTYISGNQAQNVRLNAMAKLKEFKCRILISTDLTSRGIDAERVNLVINMDLPHDSETYLHRVGRAGRFGSYGAAVNFVAEGKEVTSLEEIQSNCGVTITSLPDDVSKLLEDEMIEASPKNSEKDEVKSFNEVEHNKTDHKNINKQDAGNIQHAGKVNSDALEVGCQMIENKIVKTEEALNNQELPVVVDKGEYNKVEEDKKIDIQHEEMKNEMKETHMSGDKQQTITIVGDNVNIQYQHSKSKMKETKQEANKEIKVEQEELKDEIQSNEEARNIQGIVANGEAEFSYHAQDDAEGNEKSEVKYQEKQSKIENTQQGARDMEQARIVKENVNDIVEFEENGSLLKNTELEGKVQLKDVAAEETFVVETQEKEIFEHKEIDSVEVFQVRKGVDRINNVNRQDMIDDNDNIKSEEADCKMVDTEKASKIPQASMVSPKKLGVTHQTTDRKLKNIFDERIISQEGIVSRVNVKVDYDMKKNGDDDAETLFGMSDLASEHEMVSEEKNEFTKALTGKSYRRDCISNQNGEGRILFQNVKHSDEDDNVDDFLIFLTDDEYELSSSEESESLDSSEEPHDSHVPISCKDFENDFEAYLKIAVCSSNDESFQDNELHTSHSSRQSLKSRIPEQPDGGKSVYCASGNAIYADDSVPTGTSSNTRAQSSYRFGQLSRSQIRKDANYSKPAAAQGNAIYANSRRSDEPSGRSSTNENNHETNAEEAMFYGATPYDVTAYMAGLPAEWKRTWYRVYDKQTKFIMNYTKYCHEKF